MYPSLIILLRLEYGVHQHRFSPLSAVAKLDGVLLGVALIALMFICLLIFNHHNTIETLVPLATIVLGFRYVVRYRCLHALLIGYLVSFSGTLRNCCSSR